MFNKIKKVLYKKIALSPAYLLIAGLLAVSLITAIGGIIGYSHELDDKVDSSDQISADFMNNKIKDIVQEKKSEKAAGSTGSENPADVSSAINKPAANSTTALSGSDSAGSNGSSNNTSSSKTIYVSLSVNGASQGTVKLKSASNQCQVLTNALSQGIISSLDMRYSSTYKTYAVYIINGIGDANAVWWTYTVNGFSPPYGCSNMPAKNGDLVNWNYVKN